MTPVKLVTAAAIALLGLIAPIKGMLIAALALCGADLVTGLLAARKRGEPIVSGKLRRTVVKMLVYEGAILGAYVAQHFLIGDELPVVNWCAGVVGLVELKSLLENLNTLSGQDLLKAVLDKLTLATDKPPAPPPNP